MKGRRLRAIGAALLALAMVICLSDLAGPGMVMANGHDCSGPTCDEQIACRQSAPAQVSSGSSGQGMAIPVAVGLDHPPAPARAVALASEPAIPRSPSVVRPAPRAPPAA